jgi:hypothetical protein
MTAPSEQEIIELAERLYAGLITDDEAARLNHLLRDDAEAQRVFLSVTTLHAGLQREFAADPAWAKPFETRPEADSPVHRTWRNRRRLAIAAGIAVVVGVIVFMFRPAAPLPEHTPEPIAKVRQALNAQWAPGSEPKGDNLAPGRVCLEAGLVDIEFRTGTVAILKGPVDVEFRAVDSAFLHSGQMLVRSAPKNDGSKFQMETPTSQLVNVGTEFGVEIEVDGSSVLQVYEGEVLASGKAADMKEPRRVLKGEAVRFGMSVHETAFWPERFVRLLPGPRDPLGRGSVPYNRSRHDSIKIPRARVALAIDADLSDWDLTHRIRSECEQPYTENYYLEAAMMYDEKSLFVSAHVGDPHPMRNQYSANEPFDKHGMGGGVALRVSTDRKAGWPLKAEHVRAGKDRNPNPSDVSDQLSFVVLWYHEPTQQACIHLRHGMDLHGRQVNPPGYRGAFRRDPDGRGYTLEYAIPWKVLHAEADPPRAGDELAAMWLVHWSDAAGRNWQGQLIEVMKPNEPGWNFKRAATWGKAIYLP